MPTQSQVVDRPGSDRPIDAGIVCPREFVCGVGRGRVAEPYDQTGIARLIVPRVIVDPTTAAISVDAADRAAVIDAGNAADRTAFRRKRKDASIIIPRIRTFSKLNLTTKYANIRIERNAAAQYVARIVAGNTSDRRHALIGNLLNVGFTYDRIRAGNDAEFVVDGDGTVDDAARIISGDHAHRNMSVLSHGHDMVFPIGAVSVHDHFEIFDCAIVCGSKIADAVCLLPSRQRDFCAFGIVSVVAPPLLKLRGAFNYMRTCPLRIVDRVEIVSVVHNRDGLASAVQGLIAFDYPVRIRP